MFRQRSHKKELLDSENIPEADLFQNLKELHTINSLLGGYKISLSALSFLADKRQTLSLVDIGCGGGDSLRAMHNWALKRGYNFNLYGVDLKKECIAYCNARHAGTGIQFIEDDYRNFNQHVNSSGIIHACLFCHHLSNEEIRQLVQFCIQKKWVLLINDLHRHFLAYYAIKWLTLFFSKSYLVKNDAPLSVLRGFKKSEWNEILKTSGAKNYTVKWRWAFRHEVIVYG